MSLTFLKIYLHCPISFYFIVLPYVLRYISYLPTYIIQTRLDVVENDFDAFLVPEDIETTYFEVEYKSFAILFPSFHFWDGKDPTEEDFVFLGDLLDSV